IEARRTANSAAHAKLTADDYIHIAGNGLVRDKKYAVSLPAAPKMGLRDLKTQIFGDVAVVTGVQAGTGATNPQDARFTHIWQRRNGQWLNVFGQNTPIRQLTPPASRLKQIETASWPKTSNRDEQAVVDALRRLNDVFAEKNAAAYDVMTAASYLRINPDGTDMTRVAYLKAVAGAPDGPKRSLPELRDFQVRVYGPVGLIVWVNRAINGSTDGVRRSRVFVREGGTWKQLISQDTVVAAP
ncbi:MAG: nuclear transport factor 2 family protein, partial [Acidobacteria bacterium]